MKRSKMIDMMDTILNNFGLNMSLLETFSLAEKILIMQETQGMLPPQIEKPKTYYSDFNPSLELITVTESVNEWEPE